MERSMSQVSARERVADGEEYDLEAQLAQAEARYAQARERSRKALDECHALEAEHDARAGLMKSARARYEMAEAKCARLKELIDELEERLG